MGNKVLINSDRTNPNKNFTSLPTRNAIECSKWMDGWMDDAILGPFQQYLNHIRTTRG